ncbi:MAG: deoxynucleoside kinase [Lachnospiraceae bacterium]|nr:deoxynucleoside kinase [Lachnospiraceae bacterium]MDY3745737.1 deoxynucleoside kinase [Lachnospiraceae bacterium]
MNKRIEICGAIASGKTSLAKILAQEGFISIYERFEDNPFLSSFYTDNEDNNVLETELVFVLLHYNLIKQKKNIGKIVCDYSLMQDYCYGANNLEQEEMSVFDNLYSHLIKQILPADLIIYLKCNVDCLLQRIKERDRKMEQSISKDYLQSNINVIENYLFTQDNILVIPSDKYNFIDIDNDKDTVIKMIKDCCEKLNIL